MSSCLGLSVLTKKTSGFIDKHRFIKRCARITFRMINLKRGIKHAFLVLDAALRLEDAPLMIL